MKKILTAFSLILALIVGGAGLSYARSFTNTVDWTDDIKTDRLSRQSGDNTSPYEFFYFHSIDFFDQPAQSVDSATLTLSHLGNSANRGEAWFITDSDAISLLPLWNSTRSNNWVDQSFDLTPLLSGISGDNWTIQLKLYENTTGTDKLWLDKSVLEGTYTPIPPLEISLLAGNNTPGAKPVPEPSSMLLLGSGLVGIGTFARRKFIK